MSKNKSSWEYVPPATNFSTMRRMMWDEESFAKLLTRFIGCDQCPCQERCDRNDEVDCEAFLTEWLKQEV